MARRLLASLLLLALGALGWWIMRPQEAPDEGLVVEVHVLAADGTPLKDAQVERVFESERLRVGEDGTLRLTHVLLRELDRPTPAAIGAAVRVHAPYFALRADRDPLRIEPQEDGTWRYEARLHPHGVLRLFVEYTHAGGAKAYPEGLAAGVIEPIGGSTVARHTSPASYRVFPGVEEIAVRLEGVAARDGAVGVATQRLFFEAPSPGHAAEHVLVPQEVQPIVGQVVPGDGPRPPSLAGRLRVNQVDEDGRESALAEIPIHEDGSFVARLTGAGRYRLEADLGFFPGPTSVTVRGGAGFDLRPSQPAAWLTLEHAGLDCTTRPARFLGRRSGDTQPPASLDRVRLGNTLSHLALPAGAWEILLEVEGTDGEPPLRGTCTIDVAGQGETRGALALETLPHGEVVVQVAPDAFGEARGGTAHLGARRRTLIPGLTERVTFRHVAAGSHEVRIEWDQPERPASVQGVEVKDGSRVTLGIEGRWP